MSCSEYDLKGYFLGELSTEERQTTRRHLEACSRCREELERLRLTRSALLSVRDEEIPRKIAFVSDKVFEPNWWQRFWRSGPRLGFASAAMLSCAILFHALSRPAPVAPLPALDAAAVHQIVEQEVAARLDAAVSQALAVVEKQHEEKSAKLLTAAQRRFDLERRADMAAVRQSFEYLRKRLNANLVQMARYAPPGSEVSR